MSSDLIPSYYLIQVNHLPNQLNLIFTTYSRKYVIFATFCGKENYTTLFSSDLLNEFNWFCDEGYIGGSDHCNMQKDIMANSTTLQYQVEIQCHTDSTTLYTCQVYSIYNTEITIRNLLMNMLGYC